jgi:hypothetical protein
MGLFDIFTGDSAKEAAAKNTALLQANQTAGTNTLQQGQTSALGALDAAKGVYQPLQSKYGAATSLGLDALGVNGAAGNTRATDAFHAGPGYQYAVDQSLQGINRAGAVGGQGLNGNTLAALSDRAGNMANQEYGNWVQNLNGYVNPELSAAGGVANADTNQAGVYTGTANNIANLGTNTTNGITNQNTQAANAELQGSGNLWGLGLNLAKLGVGAATGGTSLLGGGGGGIVLGGRGRPRCFGAN